MTYLFALRKNHSRGLTALFCGLLLGVFLLTGCQQKPEGPLPTLVATLGGMPPSDSAETPKPASTSTIAGPTPTPEAVLHVDLPKLRGQVVTFWHPWQGDLEQRVQEAAKTFNQTNEWGLKVQVRSWYSAGALYDAINEVLESDTQAEGSSDLPNIIAGTTEQLAFWAQGSDPAVIDLAPYVVDTRAGLSEAEMAAYQPVFWGQDVSGSSRFGLPALRGARVLFYNQSWAEELGFSRPPTTPAEFEAQACAAAKENNGARLVDLYGTGGWLVDSDALTTLSWLAAFDADPVPEKDGQPYAFQSPQAEEALVFLRDLVSNGCAWVALSSDPYEHFARRKALFYAGSLSDLYTQAGWQEQVQSDDQWMILPFPGKDGKPVVYSAGYAYALLKGTPEAQLGGWLFARWLARPENAGRLAEALPSLPVSSPVAAQLSDYRNNFPWDQILPLMEGVRPAPGLASWRMARRPLEDAAWQVYHLPPDGLGEVLPYLDETVQEILTK